MSAPPALAADPNHGPVGTSPASQLAAFCPVDKLNKGVVPLASTSLSRPSSATASCAVQV